MRLHLILLYFFIAGFLVTGSLSKRDSYVLKTRHASFGMTSLRMFSPTASEQAVVLQEYKKQIHLYGVWYSGKTGYSRYTKAAIPLAMALTIRDNFFILFYVALFVYFFYRHRANYIKPGYMIAIGIVLAAGLCDFVANMLVLRSLHLADRQVFYTGLSWFIFILSLIKWTLIIISMGLYYFLVIQPLQVAFLKAANKWLSEFVEELWRFRIVVIGLAVLYAILNLVPQGEDLVIMINGSKPAVAVFIFLALVLATLNWYLPKTYDDARIHEKRYDFKSLYSDNSHNYGTGHIENIKTYISRVAGSVTLLIPAIGILTTLKTYQALNDLHLINPALVFVLLVIFYLEVLRNNWFDIIFKSKGTFSEWRYWLLFVLSGALVAFTIFSQSGKSIQASSLFWVFASLVGLSVLFLVTVNYRRQFAKSIPFVPLLFVFSIIVLLSFLCLNIGPWCIQLIQTTRYSSLPTVVTGIIFYTFAASYLLLLGKKTNVRYITVLLVLGIMISSGSITNYHKVSTVCTDTCRRQADLRTYIRAWLASRRKEIAMQDRLGKAYPVFFVNAYGGGIRAAAWTALVVGRANWLLRQNSAALGNDFEHYVFSFSGASGGTIGFSMLDGARLIHPHTPKLDNIFSNQSEARHIFQQDYLSADIVGILGRDFWAGSTGTALWKDRAALNEQGWEETMEKYGIRYGASFKFSWPIDSVMDLPLIVSNTYDIDRGTKGVLSPVLLSQHDFPGATLLQDLIPPNKDIHLSSAAFLSARFPFVSPTGKFDNYHHFTDGGTIENSGAETSAQLIKVFKGILDSLTKVDTVFKCLKINILSIPNSIPAMDSVDKVTNLYEGIAPVYGILNTLNGNELKADSTISYMAHDSTWKYYSVSPGYVPIYNGEIAPILPLGWQLSDYAIELMQGSVKKQPALDEIEKLFSDNFK